MGAILSCATDSHNIYTINRNKKLLFLTHPSLIPFLYNQNEKADEDSYYARKAAYLKEHGYLEDINHRYDGTISLDTVEYNLANLKQIVFEVTDACNLRCKYCAYGELYSDHDERHAQKMTFASAKNIIDFLVNIWNNGKQEFTQKVIYISFYGGEPLLNMPFIRQVIEYVESLHIANRTIEYTMTSNAMLLDRYMDYLAEKNFGLLISLDGNKWNNSYRVTASDEDSFERNIANVDLLKEKYPEYFEKHVNFNTVLHNRNTVDEVFKFIKERYGKQPRITSLNTTGIRADKQEEFNNMFRNIADNLQQSKDYELLIDEMFMNSPEYHDVCLFLYKYNQNVYRSYNDLFALLKAENYIPTGGCTPFDRKIFITVNGKVLACERIGQQYGLGVVNPETPVDLSFQKIADMHNHYLDKLRAQCKTCYMSQSCMQCMYTINQLDSSEKIKCPGFTNREDFARYVSRNLSFMEKHPTAYERVMEVVLN